MKDFKETDTFARTVDELFRQYDLHRAQEITENERLLADQKTIFYKFYCKVVYRHLFKDGICIRCGVKERESK